MRIGIHVVKELATCLKKVDLVRCDESPHRSFIALDLVDDISIPLPFGANRQVAADKVNVLDAELLGPCRKQARRGRLGSAHPDEDELAQRQSRPSTRV